MWPNIPIFETDQFAPVSLAGYVERSTAQAPVVEVSGIVEASLQVPSLRNLPTEPVVAHIEGLQLQLGHHLRDAPIDLVVVDIKKCQAPVYPEL